jgi:putrescine importer
MMMNPPPADESASTAAPASVNHPEERHPGETQFKRVLTTPRLVAFGLAYINLMGVFTLYGLATKMTAGMMALAFVVATVAMALTALSYAAMSSQFVAAGSVYSYVSKVVSPGPAFLVGWAVMLDYLILPLLNFLLIGLYMHQLLPGAPQWAYSLVGLIVIVALAVKGVNESAALGFVTTLAGFVFIVVFAGYLVASITTHGHGVGSVFDTAGFFTAEALSSPQAGIGSVFGACAILCLIFLGFDGITTFAEETRDPRRQVGRAIILTCALSGVVFILVSYLMQLAWPQAWQEMHNPDVASSELILRIAGPAMNVVFTSIFVVGCIGSGLSALSSGARILYSMGHDGVLPRPLGRLNARFRTPVTPILLIGAFGVLALFTSLMDISSIVNFGALVAFMAVNLCVVVQYTIRNKRRGVPAILLYAVLPVLGFVVDFVIWVNLDGTAKVIGFSWTALGVVVLAILTRGFRRPMRTLTRM